MRVAVIQLNPTLGETARNLQAIEEAMARAASAGARLAVFPECAITGYVYQSLSEALAVAEPIPGPSTDRLVTAARRHDLHAVVGTLERVGDRCYNTAVLIGPQGIVGRYRKAHTLCLGVDRFTTPGDTPFAVHEVLGIRLGILICYDLRFPEAARSLALAGAQLIALPTNWPVTSFIQPDIFTRTRAAENRVFLLAANRVGEERGTIFLGRSQIVGPAGDVRAEADSASDDMLVLDLDPGEADIKKMVLRPGEHEFDFFADRRPELYDRLPLPSTVPARTR